MFSARNRLLPKRKGRRPEEKKGGRRDGIRLPEWLSFERLLLGRDAGLRRRISIQVWLTALFLLVTAFAAVTAYSIIYPRLEETVERTAEASFRQVGEKFEEQLQTTPRLTEEYITYYALNRGVQWGVIRESDDQVLRGDPGEYNAGVVQRALETGSPDADLTESESADHQGQTLATYAAPINVPGEYRTALVFTRYYTQSDIENCGSCGNVCLLAGAVPECILGQCVIKECIDGAYDIDGAVATGCEYSCPVPVLGPETCNGLDDDCDGLLDALDPDLTPPGNLCTVTPGTPCESTVVQCNGAMGWSCVYPPEVEVVVMPPTTGNPSGAGELGVAAACAAVACAYARAVGKMPTSFPVNHGTLSFTPYPAQPSTPPSPTNGLETVF